MKKFMKWLAGISIVLVFIVISFIGPIDRTPLAQQPFYQHMMKELDTLTPVSHPFTLALKAGWSEANITPSYSMPMAGYTPRAKFESVHDSLYAKIMVLDNGSITCYFLSTDLLLFPPALKDRVEQKMKASGMKNYFLYISSTHTHNGVGGWNESILGKLVLGTYHQEWVEQTAQAIVEQMKLANDAKLSAKLSYFENDVSEWVENRIAFDQGKIDGKLRGVSLSRVDGSKGIMFAFSAHATSIGKKSLSLSGDYPAETIRLLKTKGWDFGMFMAGMVGSHRFRWMPEGDYEALARAAGILADKITTASFTPPTDSLTIQSAHIPIRFGASQLRLAKDWRVRDWVFRSLANPLQGELTFLEIGDIVFVGTPCDFSGEIFEQENLQQIADSKKLIVTSFNGNYIGYITYDAHYETLSKDEVMAMNWVGPHYGQYFSDMMKSVLRKRE